MCGQTSHALIDGRHSHSVPQKPSGSVPHHFLVTRSDHPLHSWLQACSIYIYYIYYIYILYIYIIYILYILHIYYILYIIYIKIRFVSAEKLEIYSEAFKAIPQGTQRPIAGMQDLNSVSWKTAFQESHLRCACRIFHVINPRKLQMGKLFSNFFWKN